jgi:trimeric autotransporter adhesin
MASRARSRWPCKNKFNTTLADDSARVRPPDYTALIGRLDSMPVNYFTIKNANIWARFLGPSAEDFRSAFGLGSDDRTIAEGNAYGVALAAAKGLSRKLKADETEIAVLKQENSKIAVLEKELAEQKRRWRTSRQPSRVWREAPAM